LVSSTTSRSRGAESELSGWVISSRTARGASIGGSSSDRVVLLDLQNQELVKILQKINKMTKVFRLDIKDTTYWQANLRHQAENYLPKSHKYLQ
jgi:hypothetical protein